ncbi:Mms4p ASCRUDRAFT_78848 [Ascoidea rubescens DSM 1968]|uniref:ERCC4 domain-containing protein n=1 Tax=Ascoidea rubescens DSM 1968 TaxID=1344418 RepID=A0A1D2VQF6_9ASCO|nr:hypothetical protein ASCRUDRAFT_78848 [Ascoidea rubescens DSM 1968]ODV63842.1 hypothetical protein ASCRUDRAFT_78848 [Ascoidea rubescens DSM 1968]
MSQHEIIDVEADKLATATKVTKEHSLLFVYDSDVTMFKGLLSSSPSKKIQNNETPSVFSKKIIEHDISKHNPLSSPVQRKSIYACSLSDDKNEIEYIGLNINESSNPNYIKSNIVCEDFSEIEILNETPAEFKKKGEFDHDRISDTLIVLSDSDPPDRGLDLDSDVFNSSKKTLSAIFNDRNADKLKNNSPTTNLKDKNKSLLKPVKRKSNSTNSSPVSKRIKNRTKSLGLLLDFTSDIVSSLGLEPDYEYDDGVIYNNFNERITQKVNNKGKERGKKNPPEKEIIDHESPKKINDNNKKQFPIKVFSSSQGNNSVVNNSISFLEDPSLLNPRIKNFLPKNLSNNNKNENSSLKVPNDILIIELNSDPITNTPISKKSTKNTRLDKIFLADLFGKSKSALDFDLDSDPIVWTPENKKVSNFLKNSTRTKTVPCLPKLTSNNTNHSTPKATRSKTFPRSIDERNSDFINYDKKLLKEINKLKTKEDCLAEIIMDIEESIFNNLSKNANLNEFFDPIEIKSLRSNNKLPLITWTRKIVSEYDSKRDIFVPVAETKKKENIAALYYSASEIIEKIQNNVLKEEIISLKTNGKFELIIVIAEGFNTHLRKLETSDNRSYASRVRKVMSTSEELSITSNNKSKLSKKKEVPQNIKMTAEEIDGQDGINWIKSFTYTISSEIYDSNMRNSEFSNIGVIRSGRDANDCYLKSLQQFKFMTNNISKNISEKFPSLMSILETYIKGDGLGKGFDGKKLARDSLDVSLKKLFTSNDPNEILNN